MPTFYWPLPQRAVSSGFTDPRSYGLHAAIDIPAPLHTPVHPVAAGRIAFAGPAGDCGLAVFIDHAEGWRSHYCHLGYVHHPAGTYVDRKATLGAVGLTGVTLGPHLHLNLFSPVQPAAGPSVYVAWVGKWAVDPLNYLTKEEEMDIIVSAPGRGSTSIVGGRRLDIASDRQKGLLLRLGYVEHTFSDSEFDELFQLFAFQPSAKEIVDAIVWRLPGGFGSVDVDALAETVREKFRADPLR